MATSPVTPAPDPQAAIAAAQPSAPPPAVSQPDSTPTQAPAQSSPPSLWKSVVVGALSGLAGAAGQTSFGGGLAAGAGGALKQQQQQRENAQQDQQQANSNQAAMDEHTKSLAQTATSYANLASIQHQIRLMAPDRATALLESRADDTEKLREQGALAPLGQPGDIATVTNQVTALQKAHPENLYIPEPIKGQDGKITYQVHQATDAPISQDVSLKTPDGKSITVPAGSATGKQVAALQLQILNQQVSDESAKNKAAAVTAAAKQTAANAAQTKANAAGNPAALTPDSLGFQPKLPPTGVQGYQKTAGSFKKNLDDLSQTEQSSQQFQDIIKSVDSGKDLTGAQSVVGLFNAIGISAEPLKGKGFRINNLTVDEHTQARGVQQAVEQKFGKLKTGEIITPQQLKDYAQIALQVRENKYVGLVNQMHNQGLNADAALPTGNGQKIDPATAHIFLTLTGGNVQAAKAAAAKKGWQ